MGVILSNNTFKLHQKVVDQVLHHSSQSVRAVPHSRRQQSLTFEAEVNTSYPMTDLTVANGGEVVVFNRTTKLRPGSDGRGRATLADAASGLINILAPGLVEISWAVAVHSVGTGGIDLWQTSLEMSKDNGLTYTIADNPVRAYNYHVDLDVSVVSPPRKFQVVRGDIWRVRLFTISNTAGGGDTALVTANGTYFTMRTL